MEEGGYTAKRDRAEEHEEEGGDGLQDDNEDEDHQPAKRNRLQARFSRSDPALTPNEDPQLHPVRSFVQRQSGPPNASYQHPSQAAQSSSGLPAAQSFNSEPIPPAHFYAKLPQRQRRHTKGFPNREYGNFENTGSQSESPPISRLLIMILII